MGPRHLLAALAVAALALAASPCRAVAAPSADATPAAMVEPSYAEWNRLLGAYYDPLHGMDYRGLKAHDGPALQRLRRDLGWVPVAQLGRDQQLAYWINLYNVNVVATVVAAFPIHSIRDLSSDPMLRLNVFKKESVPFGNGRISLDAIENEKLRQGFHDPRIHFAINCAARSCPPLRTEAFIGARVNEELDDQVRRDLAGPGVRIESHDGAVTVHTSKILDWFDEDFTQWAGGKVAFLRHYLPPEAARRLPAHGGSIAVEFDDYDWALNDWQR